MSQQLNNDQRNRYFEVWLGFLLHDSSQVSRLSCYVRKEVDRLGQTTIGSVVILQTSSAAHPIAEIEPNEGRVDRLVAYCLQYLSQLPNEG